MTLPALLKLIRKHLVLMIVLPIICVLGTALFYLSSLSSSGVNTAKVSMYVLAKPTSDLDTMTDADLTASQMYSNDVAKLITSNRVQSDTAKALGLPSLSGYSISVTNEKDSRILTISVTGESAEEVEAIANKIVFIVDGIARDVMDLKSVTAIGKAATSSASQTVPYVSYMGVVFLAGVFLALLIIVIIDLVDTRVRNPEEIEEMLGVPVVGRIPAARS